MITAITSYTKRKYHVPESFNELSRDQLIKLCGLLISKRQIDAGILQALRILLKRSHLSFALMNAKIKEQLLPSCEWIFQDNTYTKQLLPYCRGFYGPAGEFVNLRMAEFHSCEMRYRMFLDNVPGALNQLIAVLYRPAKDGYNFTLDPDGDAREKYNGHTVKYRARIIAKWPEAVKQGILLFYDGCRAKLIKDHPTVFTAGEDSTPEDQFQGMFLMMRVIAESGTYGDFDRVEDLYVLTALSEARQKIKEQEEMKTDNEQS